MIDDPLVALFYMSRPSSIRGFPKRRAGMTLSPDQIRCLAWKIQNGNPRDKVVRSLAREARQLTFLVEDAVASLGVKRRLKRRQPRVVGPHVITADILEEVDVQNHPAAKPMFDDVDRLYDLYEHLIRIEWDQLDEHVQKPFSSYAKKQMRMTELAYYRLIRPLYYGVGFRSPPVVLNTIRGNARFLGRKLVGGVHPEFLRRLKKAEREFDKLNRQLMNRSAPGSWLPQRIGCFVPRTTTSGAWSNHALGLAIDVDPKKHPFLRGKRLELLNEMLIWLHDIGQLKRKLALDDSWVKLPFGPNPKDARAVQLYRNTRDISHATMRFLRQYLDPWFRRIVARSPPPTSSPDGEAHDLVGRMFRAWGGKGPAKNPNQWRGYRNLRRVRREGFVTFPMTLLIAMKRAGIRSGTEFTRGKDIMHFDVPRRELYQLSSPRPRGC